MKEALIKLLSVGDYIPIYSTGSQSYYYIHIDRIEDDYITGHTTPGMNSVMTISVYKKDISFDEELSRIYLNGKKNIFNISTHDGKINEKRYVFF